MNTTQRTLAIVAMALACTTAAAQFVKGNEAVKILADGSRKVELPPMPATGPVKRSKPCEADKGCHGGAWLMVETTDGLMECTEAYARPGTCRASSYGTTRRMRAWVVKAPKGWQKCQLPDLGSKCVDMFAKPPHNLPYPAAQ